MFLVRAILIIYITRYCQVFLKAYLSVYGLSQSIVLLNTFANSPVLGFAHKRLIILAIVCNGSCLLVSKPYERYY